MELLKWSLIARLRGCRVMFVSVGAGPVGSAPGRFFVKLALSLADYRSYRDVPSREVVEGIGVRAKDDRIYPDLVFGLSLPFATDGGGSRGTTRRRSRLDGVLREVQRRKSNA